MNKSRAFLAGHGVYGAIVGGVYWMRNNTTDHRHHEEHDAAVLQRS